MSTIKTTLAHRWTAALGDKAWGRRMKIVVPGDIGTLLAVYEDDAGICTLYVNFDEECACQRYDRDGEGFDMLEPDTDDPATLGVMLGIVRKLYDDPHIRLRWSPTQQRWEVFFGGSHHKTGVEPHGNTEGEALVCAAEDWKRRQA